MKLKVMFSIKVMLLHVKIMCSQVSLRLFHQIKHVCRNIRGNNNGFVGMQVVACGDFLQLPPVPDMGHGDAGEYALTSKFMQAMGLVARWRKVVHVYISLLVQIYIFNLNSAFLCLTLLQF